MCTKLAERWHKAAAHQKLEEFATHLRVLDAQYARELGRNGYAALNVITDLASRPSLVISTHAAVNRLQRRAAAWAEEFVGEAEKPGFQMEKYLEPTLSEAGQWKCFSTPGG